ncbi:MAG: pilin [bacterium]|nr:pilin [bacterium]
MRKILLILILLIILTPVFALAQTEIELTLTGESSNPCSSGSGDGGSLPLCINQIYVWSLGLSALLAMLMMVLGGYMVMTAAGNAQQSSTGKEMIWSSIIGMGILFAAFLILNTINPDLVDFSNLSTDPFEQTTAPDPSPSPALIEGGIDVNLNP